MHTFTCYTTEVLEFCPSKTSHMGAETEPNDMDTVEGQPEVTVQPLKQHGQLFAHETRVRRCSHIVWNHSSCFPVDTDDVALLLQNMWYQLDFQKLFIAA